MIDVRVPYFIKRPLCRRPPPIVEVRLPKIPKCSHILRTRRGEEVAPASERARASRRLGPKLADPPSARPSIRRGTYGARALRAGTEFHFGDRRRRRRRDGVGRLTERTEREAGGRRDKALGDKLQNNEALTLRFFPNIPFYSSSLPLLPLPQRASSLLLLSSRFSSLSSILLFPLCSLFSLCP